MKFTKDWLKDHLKTNKTETQIIEKLNNIGLEVEKVEPIQNELSDLIDYIVSSPPADTEHPVLLPGELERSQMKYRSEEGIEIDSETFSQIINAAESLGIERSILVQ